MVIFEVPPRYEFFRDADCRDSVSIVRLAVFSISAFAMLILLKS